MNATTETVFALAGRTATRIHLLGVSQDDVDAAVKDAGHPYWQAIELAFPKKIEMVSPVSASDTWRAGVIQLYRDHMQIDVAPELEKFVWPDQRPEGFNWFVFRPKGLTARVALDKLCRPQFAVGEYIDLDAYSLERQTDQSHLVLCRETVEPDHQWLNHSGDDMSATKIPFLDICDRVVLEATYYLIFKKHLDIKGLTRCPRSRYGGAVALAYWYGSLFKVNAGLRDGHNPLYGGRQAIPLKTKS